MVRSTASPHFVMVPWSGRACSDGRESGPRDSWDGKKGPARRFLGALRRIFYTLAGPVAGGRVQVPGNGGGKKHWSNLCSDMW